MIIQCMECCKTTLKLSEVEEAKKKNLTDTYDDQYCQSCWKSGLIDQERIFNA